MRKLGIGKKKKKKRGDADDRTPAEMQADLKKGIQEATMFVKGGETDKKKIKQIENKYDLRITVLRNSLNKFTKFFLRKTTPRQGGMRQLQTKKKRRAAEPGWTLSAVEVSSLGRAAQLFLAGLKHGDR